MYLYKVKQLKLMKRLDYIREAFGLTEVHQQPIEVKGQRSDMEWTFEKGIAMVVDWYEFNPILKLEAMSIFTNYIFKVDHRDDLKRALMNCQIEMRDRDLLISEGFMEKDGTINWGAVDQAVYLGIALSFKSWDFLIDRKKFGY